MNTKQKFIQETINSNQTISNTIKLARKSENEEIKRITIGDILSYDKELILEQPTQEHYKDYCIGILDDDNANSMIDDYFDVTLDFNKKITFKQFLSCYIKHVKFKINEDLEEESESEPFEDDSDLDDDSNNEDNSDDDEDDEEDDEEDNEDEDDEDEDDEDEDNEDEDDEVNTEIRTLLENYKEKLNSIKTAQQMIDYLEEGNISPWVLSFYKDRDETPDSDNFLEDQINKILKKYGREYKLDCENDLVCEIFNQILSDLDYDFTYERFYEDFDHVYDEQRDIIIFEFNRSGRKFSLGVIGQLEDPENGDCTISDCGEFFEAVHVQQSILVWKQK